PATDRRAQPRAELVPARRAQVAAGDCTRHDQTPAPGSGPVRVAGLRRRGGAQVLRFFRARQSMALARGSWLAKIRPFWILLVGVTGRLSRNTTQPGAL